MLGPLELKLQMLVSHHVGAGNLTRVLYRSSKCSYLRGHLSNPAFEMGFCYTAQASLKPALASWVSGITGCASHHLVQKLHPYQVPKSTHTHIHRRTKAQVSVLRYPGQHRTLTILGNIRELMNKVATGIGNNKKPYVYREIISLPPPIHKAGVTQISLLQPGIKGLYHHTQIEQRQKHHRKATVGLQAEHTGVLTIQARCRGRNSQRISRRKP